MVHALQDQHFDLETLSAPYRRIVDGEPRNEDGELALRCLVEGEATYIEVLHIMGDHLAGDPESERKMFRMQASVDLDDMIRQMQAGGPGADGPDEMAVYLQAPQECPAYLSHSFHAAYGQGAYLVMTLRQHGGWAAVSDAFVHPPRSTEQTLHPEKLTTDRDDPTPVTFTVLESLQGTGWTEIDAAIHGEFYLGLMLRNFGCDGHAARRAAAGWVRPSKATSDWTGGRRGEGAAPDVVATNSIRGRSGPGPKFHARTTPDEVFGRDKSYEADEQFEHALRLGTPVALATKRKPLYNHEYGVFGRDSRRRRRPGRSHREGTRRRPEECDRRLVDQQWVTRTVHSPSMPRYEPFDWYQSPLYYDLVFDSESSQEADFLEAVHERYGLSRGRRCLEPACGSASCPRTQPNANSCICKHLSGPWTACGQPSADFWHDRVRAC